MKNHETNAFMQTNAITAIENLCKNSGEKVDSNNSKEDRKSTFRTLGAIDLIEKARKTFSKDEEVVSTALRTLSILPSLPYHHLTAPSSPIIPSYVEENEMGEQ